MLQSFLDSSRLCCRPHRLPSRVESRCLSRVRTKEHAIIAHYRLHSTYLVPSPPSGPPKRYRNRGEVAAIVVFVCECCREACAIVCLAVNVDVDVAVDVDVDGIHTKTILLAPFRSPRIVTCNNAAQNTRQFAGKCCCCCTVIVSQRGLC